MKIRRSLPLLLLAGGLGALAACGDDGAPAATVADAAPATGADAAAADAAPIAPADAAPPDAAPVAPADAAPVAPADAAPPDAQAEATFTVRLEGPGVVEVRIGALPASPCTSATAPCVYARPAGDAVSLHALDAPARTFQGWRDCVASGTASDCVLPASAAQVTAVFASFAWDFVGDFGGPAPDIAGEIAAAPDGAFVVLSQIDQSLVVEAYEADHVTRRWRRDEGTRLYAPGASLVLDSSSDVVFLAADGLDAPLQLVKLDGHTGAEVFRKSLFAPAFRDAQLVALPGGELLACANKGGEETCQRYTATGAAAGAPIVFAGEAGRPAFTPVGTLVFALTTRAGNDSHTELAAFGLDGSPGFRVPIDAPGTRAEALAQAYDGGATVFVLERTSSTSSVVALATDDGRVLWRAPLGPTSLLSGGARVASGAGQVMVLTSVWNTEVDLGNEWLFAGNPDSVDTVFIGLDASTGALRRARRLGQTGLADVEMGPDRALWITGTSGANPTVIAGRSVATPDRDPLVVRLLVDL